MLAPLTKLLKICDLSASAFAELTGLKEGPLEKREFGRKAAQKIASLTGVSPVWLKGAGCQPIVGVSGKAFTKKSYDRWKGNPSAWEKHTLRVHESVAKRLSGELSQLLAFVLQCREETKLGVFERLHCYERKLGTKAGHNLQGLRAACGVSLAELSRVSGVGLPLLKVILRTKDPVPMSANVAVRLCAATGAHPEWLLRAEDGGPATWLVCGNGNHRLIKAAANDARGHYIRWRGDSSPQQREQCRAIAFKALANALRARLKGMLEEAAVDFERLADLIGRCYEEFRPVSELAGKVPESTPIEFIRRSPLPSELRETVVREEEILTITNELYRPRKGSKVEVEDETGKKYTARIGQKIRWMASGQQFETVMPMPLRNPANKKEWLRFRLSYDVKVSTDSTTMILEPKPAPFSEMPSSKMPSWLDTLGVIKTLGSYSSFEEYFAHRLTLAGRALKYDHAAIAALRGLRKDGEKLCRPRKGSRYDADRLIQAIDKWDLRALNEWNDFLEPDSPAGRRLREKQKETPAAPIPAEPEPIPLHRSIDGKHTVKAAMPNELDALLAQGWMPEPVSLVRCIKGNYIVRPAMPNELDALLAKGWELGHPPEGTVYEFDPDFMKGLPMPPITLIPAQGLEEGPAVVYAQDGSILAYTEVDAEGRLCIRQGLELTAFMEGSLGECLVQFCAEDRQP